MTYWPLWRDCLEATLTWIPFCCWVIVTPIIVYYVTLLWHSYGLILTFTRRTYITCNDTNVWYKKQTYTLLLFFVYNLHHTGNKTLQKFTYHQEILWQVWNYNSSVNVLSANVKIQNIIRIKKMCCNENDDTNLDRWSNCFANCTTIEKLHTFKFCIH